MAAEGDAVAWFRQRLEQQLSAVEQQQSLLLHQLKKEHEAMLADVASKFEPKPQKEEVAVADEPQKVEEPPQNGEKAQDATELVPGQTCENGEKDTDAKQKDKGQETGSTDIVVKPVKVESGTGLHRRHTPSFMQSRFEEEDKPTGLRAVVENPWFELTSALIIVGNCVLMAFECQYAGLDAGYHIKFRDYDKAASEVWPGAREAFEAIEITFQVIFVLELIIRVASSPSRAVKSFWIWYDFFLITFGILYAMGLGLTLNPTVFRISRLARLLRILKILRAARGLEGFFLLWRALEASVGILFWSFIIILALQIATGMCIAQLLNPYLMEGPRGEADKERQQVFEFFGTFSRTVVSMFEMSQANWVASCRVLSNNVHPGFGPFYVFYRCVLCFALIRVVGAVFITETMRVVAADDAVVAMRKKKEKAAYFNKLKAMFDELDESGDGMLSYDEFQQLIEDPNLKMWAAAMDINVSDLQELFAILDDGDGHISADEFMMGLAKLKGQATALHSHQQAKMLHLLSDRVKGISLTVQELRNTATAQDSLGTPKNAKSRTPMISGTTPTPRGTISLPWPPLPRGQMFV